jgi:hypothetical protein
MPRCALPNRCKTPKARVLAKEPAFFKDNEPNHVENVTLNIPKIKRHRWSIGQVKAKRTGLRAVSLGAAAGGPSRRFSDQRNNRMELVTQHYSFGARSKRPAITPGKKYGAWAGGSNGTQLTPPTVGCRRAASKSTTSFHPVSSTPGSAQRSSPGDFSNIPPDVQEQIEMLMEDDNIVLENEIQIIAIFAQDEAEHESSSKTTLAARKESQTSEGIQANMNATQPNEDIGIGNETFTPPRPVPRTYNPMRTPVSAVAALNTGATEFVAVAGEVGSNSQGAQSSPPILSPTVDDVATPSRVIYFNPVALPASRILSGQNGDQALWGHSRPKQNVPGRLVRRHTALHVDMESNALRGISMEAATTPFTHDPTLANVPIRMEVEEDAMGSPKGAIHPRINGSLGRSPLASSSSAATVSSGRPGYLKNEVFESPCRLSLFQNTPRQQVATDTEDDLIEPLFTGPENGGTPLTTPDRPITFPNQSLKTPIKHIRRRRRFSRVSIRNPSLFGTNRANRQTDNDDSDVTDSESGSLPSLTPERVFGTPQHPSQMPIEQTHDDGASWWTATPTVCVTERSVPSP